MFGKIEKVKATFFAKQTTADLPESESLIATAQVQPKSIDTSGLTELLRRHTEVMGQMVDLLHNMKVKHGESS